MTSKIGTDGVFIGFARIHVCKPEDAHLSLCADLTMHEGAELRPIVPMPSRLRRATWPVTALACGIVFALDHGNVALAAICSMWLLGWLVGR